MSAEQLATRRERISYLNGLMVGLKEGFTLRDIKQRYAALEKYRKEIDSLNDQIDQEAKV